MGSTAMENSPHGKNHGTRSAGGVASDTLAPTPHSPAALPNAMSKLATRCPPSDRADIRHAGRPLTLKSTMAVKINATLNPIPSLAYLFKIQDSESSATAFNLEF